MSGRAAGLAPPAARQMEIDMFGIAMFIRIAVVLAVAAGISYWLAKRWDGDD